MPQLPESSQPRLTSWVARALLSGYFVAITKQHFFGKPIFKANSPNLPRVGFHFLWRVQRFQRIHLHFISDTLIHYGHGGFSWPFRYLHVGKFPAGKRLDFAQTRQVDRWHRGWHVSLGWTSGQLSYRSGTLASGCQSHGLSIRSLVEQPWNLKKTLQETTKMAIAGKSTIFFH